MNYQLVKLTCGVLATVGLYSVLYRENKFYRFWEHLFLGLASGWMMVALWTDTLKQTWWDNMVGRVSDVDPSKVEALGYWPYAFLLPIGLLGYTVFSKKHNWLSRIPIGIIIGLWSGQQFSAWMNRYIPQIQASAQPLWPTTTETFMRPNIIGTTEEFQRELATKVYPSQAIVNLIALITVLSVLSYFLFSFDFKSKFMQGSTKLGRYLLMVGFGAIFGSTVMMRFSLLIDRMYFIWIEWLQNAVLHRGG